MGFRFTIFSPPPRTAASRDSLRSYSALAAAKKPRSCAHARPTDHHRGAANAGMAVFGRSPAVMSKREALNRPSQPRGRALMHGVPSAGPVGPEATCVLAAVGGRRRYLTDAAPRKTGFESAAVSKRPNVPAGSAKQD